jgi:hypothetical protein
MTFKKGLAIALLVGALGFSSTVWADGKNASSESKRFHLIGHVLKVDVHTRSLMVKDNYSGKLYKVQVPKDVRVQTLNTSQRYTHLEQLLPGTLIEMQVRAADSEATEARAR